LLSSDQVSKESVEPMVVQQFLDFDPAWSRYEFVNEMAFALQEVNHALKK
jgi:hypothetical protein